MTHHRIGIELNFIRKALLAAHGNNGRNVLVQAGDAKIDDRILYSANPISTMA
jgi:hypothetical protein